MTTLRDKINQSVAEYQKNGGKIKEIQYGGDIYISERAYALFESQFSKFVVTENYRAAEHTQGADS